MFNRVMAAFVLLMGIMLPLGARESGAGGIIQGWNFSEESEDLTEYGKIFSGGYGYGTLANGQRVGGYILLGSSGGDEDMLFSVGMLTGREISQGPLRLGFSLLFGPAFLDVSPEDPDYNPSEDNTRFAFFAEGDLEGGILIFPFMQLVAYAGVQCYGQFDEPVFSHMVPVGGVKVIWGAF